MNSINVNIPVVNLPQVGNQQSETHRAPMVHQTQNADLNRDRLDLQMRAAQEAEQTEGKIVDAKDHKEEGKRKPRKREDDGENGERGEEEQTDDDITVMTDNGQIIDLKA